MITENRGRFYFIANKISKEVERCKSSWKLYTYINQSKSTHLYRSKRLKSKG